MNDEHRERVIIGLAKRGETYRKISMSVWGYYNSFTNKEIKRIIASQQANPVDSNGGASDPWQCGDCYSEHETEIEAACCCH